MQKVFEHLESKSLEARLIEKMGSKEIAEAFLRDEYVLTKVIKPAEVLSSLATYWQTREGLYVHPTFTERILPYAKGDATVDISSVDFIDLPQNMSDSEIITTYLGGMEEAKKNAFTLNQVQASIDKQWTGGDGQLLTNGYTYIFYVLGEDGVLFCLSVFRLGGKWFVSVFDLDGRGLWRAGNRVFRNRTKRLGVMS